MKLLAVMSLCSAEDLLQKENFSFLWNISGLNSSLSRQSVTLANTSELYISAAVKVDTESCQQDHFIWGLPIAPTSH